MGNNIKLLAYKGFIRFMLKTRIATGGIINDIPVEKILARKGASPEEEAGKLIKLIRDLFLKSRDCPRDFLTWINANGTMIRRKQCFAGENYE